jgi:hypothetical protein
MGVQKEKKCQVQREKVCTDPSLNDMFKKLTLTPLCKSFRVPLSLLLSIFMTTAFSFSLSRCWSLAQKIVVARGGRGGWHLQHCWFDMGGGAVRRKKDLPVAISMSLTCMNAH